MEVFSVASSMQYCQSTEYIVLLLTVVSIDVTSVAVFFALFLPHEDCNSFAPYCIVCCGLSVCLIFHSASQAGRFSGKFLEHKMCIVTFATNLSETFFILRKFKQGLIKNLCAR